MKEDSKKKLHIDFVLLFADVMQHPFVTGECGGTNFLLGRSVVVSNCLTNSFTKRCLLYYVFTYGLGLIK